MMQIRRLTYRRIKNLGNYESSQLEAEAIVGDEDPIEAFEELKFWVHEQLEIQPKPKPKTKAEEEIDAAILDSF